MLAEHTFVTTIDAAPAFAAAASAAERLGFKPAGGDGVTSAQWSRGPKKPGYRSIKRLPMRLRLDFDRGRITVALAIDEARPETLVGEYALAVLSALETVTCSSNSSDALTGTIEAERKLRRRHFWQKFWIGIVLGTVLLGLSALVIAAIATRR